MKTATVAKLTPNARQAASPLAQTPPAGLGSPANPSLTKGTVMAAAGGAVAGGIVGGLIGGLIGLPRIGAIVGAGAGSAGAVYFIPTTS